VGRFRGDTNADQAWQELKTLLGARIDNALAGKISTKSMDDILEEELTGDGPA